MTAFRCCTNAAEKPCHACQGHTASEAKRNAIEMQRTINRLPSRGAKIRLRRTALSLTCLAG